MVFLKSAAYTRAGAASAIWCNRALQENVSFSKKKPMFLKSSTFTQERPQPILASAKQVLLLLRQHPLPPHPLPPRKNKRTLYPLKSALSFFIKEPYLQSKRAHANRSKYCCCSGNTPTHLPRPEKTKEHCISPKNP